MSDLLHTVQTTIEKHRLITPGDVVLVALSGGADSVCLLDCLLEISKTMSFSVCAAHLNHCLRGEDAEEDQRFVTKLCETLGITLYASRVDIRKLASETKIGLEEAGRNERYRFFKKVAKEQGVNVIATAHHANDNVETVLMRLVRGTGPLGLGGIPYRNGEVVRPLLDATRQEIEAYLKEKNLSYRTDSSNFETTYTRNRVRHGLIPMLEEQFNPSFSQTFSEKIQLYSACGAFIKEEAEKLFDRLVLQNEKNYVVFECGSLLSKNEFLVSTMLHSTLSRRFCDGEVGEEHIRSVLSILKDGKGAVSLPGGGIAEIYDDKLYLRSLLQPALIPFELPTEKTFEITRADLKVSLQNWSGDCGKNTANTIYLDADSLKGKKIYIRSRLEGDVFYPTGMDGRKKLQDYFVDRKVPHFLRDSIPVVATEDDIIWIVGYRGDRRFLANEKSTAVLQLKVHKEEQK